MARKTLEEDAFEEQERVVQDLFENIDQFEDNDGEYSFIEQCERRVSSSEFLTAEQWRRAQRLCSRLKK